MLRVIQSIFLIPELKNRVLFSFAMLVIFRVGAHIPIPGIDSGALQQFYENSAASSIISFFNTFSGGALIRLSIFALGILPYISASIVMNLMTVIFPALERIAREGDSGRRKISQYTRYGTILLSIVQGYGIAVGIQSITTPGGASIVNSTLGGFGFTASTMITLTAGTAFVMWLAEKISERGIGNGASLIIFSGIIAGIPSGLSRTFQLLSSNELPIFVVITLAIIIIGVTGIVVLFETAQRKISINYARRTQTNQMAGGTNTYLPLKINASGVIPIIFASSLLAFPSTFTAFVETPWIKNLGVYLTPSSIIYNMIFALLIFFFCYFYNALQFNPIKISDDLKRYGGFVPGIRPGEKTASYLNSILGRLTFVGATYLSAISILPNLLYGWFNVPFFFGGTSLLIVVGVALDLANKVETFLVNQNYDGFIKKMRSRSRY
ncbi:MAG: preprotein translocase subunit SecY [SAR324 cluster bacterium]|nr:preprotein translocase subunit SecY [SAR324 cluster bacterium]